MKHPKERDELAKIPVNISLPAALDRLREEEREAQGMGVKDQWRIFTAAFLMLMESEPDVRQYYYDQVYMNRDPARFEFLLDRVKRGDIRREAEHFSKLMSKNPRAIVAADKLDAMNRADAAHPNAERDRLKNLKGKKS